MPASLTPYLSLNDKKEMAECWRAGVDTTVRNRLQGECSVDTLTASFGCFRLSSSRSMELVLLPRICGDSVVCVLDSYTFGSSSSSFTPVSSRISFYDTDWNALPNDSLMPSFDISDLVLRPDSMCLDEYSELVSCFSPALVRIDYSLSSGRFELMLCPPFSLSDERERLEGIIRKRMLSWDGDKLIFVEE
ncbi:MAG: DUF3256 family protein [Prevotella sp.]|nr:DUF3256 family protein [Prevotella sp.]